MKYKIGEKFRCIGDCSDGTFRAKSGDILTIIEVCSPGRYKMNNRQHFGGFAIETWLQPFKLTDQIYWD